jgi:hypothetical protein
MKCAANTGVNNEDPDAHPADFNDSKVANSIDVGQYVPRLNSEGPGGRYHPRYDLSGSGIGGPDLRLTTIDVGKFVPILNDPCV